ncbi:MAG: hypothetical protein M1828_004130 [Chrysothrix sp. TS-e1954]|nr:MAG: hypothetical protein M1828_004130 [Chrysothrix sp. TS-e1954]
MTSPEAPPAIILCHGAWHVPEHYADLLNRLQRNGFETFCPLLPTCNGKRPPDALQHDDVSVIRALLESLVQAGRSILVVLHSYGGVVGSNAIQDDVSKTSRSSRGLEGGVIAIVYMCAFLLLPGGTVKSATHVDVDPVIVADDGTSTVDNPRSLFYNDLDQEVAMRYADMLVPHSVQGFTVQVTGTPWKNTPTSYVYCSEDNAIPLAWQQKQVKAAKQQGSDIQEFHLKSGHSPYLSKTEEVSTILQQVWTKYCGKQTIA